MIIRPERMIDYPAIANVHTRAFGNRVNEALVLSLLRHRRDYDPNLSLVAEIGDRIVGHALFSPHLIRLLDVEVRAVNLAPIGILPAFQRQGIGSRLKREGHRVAESKGFAVSFLLGHPSYYPRFGYRTGAFGTAETRAAIVLSSSLSLTARSPTVEDIPVLWQLWQRDESSVDFALDPGHDLLAWVSPNPAIESLVYEEGKEVVGYSRQHQREPGRPRVFLAAGSDIARLMAGAIVERAKEPEVVLPIHPFSRSASGFATSLVHPLKAAMAAPLNSGPLNDYFALVQSGKRIVGRVTWPVAFDL